MRTMMQVAIKTLLVVLTALACAWSPGCAEPENTIDGLPVCEEVCDMDCDGDTDNYRMLPDAGFDCYACGESGRIACYMEGWER